jgi:hypothetical protein
VNPVARMMRCLWLGLLVSPVLSCGKATNGDPPPICEAAPAGVGRWSHSAFPEGLDLAGPSSGNGSLWFVERSCSDCAVATLAPLETRWSVNVYQGGPWYNVGSVVFDGDFIVDYGFRDRNPRADELTVEVLDQKSLARTTYPLDSGRQFRGTVGGEAIFWAGIELSVDEADTGVDLRVARFDGSTLDLEDQTTRLIPKARDDVRYVDGDGGLTGGPEIVSVWTSAGLFVWGTIPNEAASWGAILSIDTLTWSELRREGADIPPSLYSHRLLSVGDDVFLFGGIYSATRTSVRRLLRYSISKEIWSEVEVPEWADPHEGAVVQDKLVFTGRCTGGGRFDPVTNTWDALSRDGGPPSRGPLFAVGDILAVTDTYYDHLTATNEVWLLDLSGK